MNTSLPPSKSRSSNESVIISQKIIPYLQTLGYKYIQANLEIPFRGRTYRPDLVAYEDEEKKLPLIVVEVKSILPPDITTLEPAVQQAYTYASILKEVRYLLVTDGIQFHWFETNIEKGIINPIASGPEFISGERFERTLSPIDSRQLFRLLSEVLDTVISLGFTEILRASLDIHRLIACKVYDEITTPSHERYKFNYSDNEPEKAIGLIKNLYHDFSIRYLGETRNNPISWYLSGPAIHTAAKLIEPYSLQLTPPAILSRVFWEVYVPYFRTSRTALPTTPIPLAKILIRLADPKPGEKVIDPACGAGLLLIETLDYIRTQVKAETLTPSFEDAKEHIYGVEILESISEIAQLNFFFSRVNPSQVINADALVENGELQPNSYDVVVLDPPIGISKTSGSDYRITTRLEESFVELSLNLLKEGGRIAVFVPETFLTSMAGVNLRRRLQRRAKIMLVMSLPTEAFAPSGHYGKASILILEKTKQIKIQPGKTIFVETYDLGYDNSGNITDDEIYSELLSVANIVAGKSFDFSAFQNLKIWELDTKSIDPSRWDTISNNPEKDDLFSILNQSPYKRSKLGEIAQIISGRSVKRHVEKPVSSIRLIQAGAVKEFEVDLSSSPYISYEEYQKAAKAEIFTGDVLITTTGQYLGRAAVFDQDGKFVASSAVTILRLRENDDPYFLAAFINSELGRQQIEMYRSAGTALPFIRRSEVGKLLVPLPSIEIQQEISRQVQKMLSDARMKREEAQELEESARALLIRRVLGENE